jgi:hypothetical protein
MGKTAGIVLGVILLVIGLALAILGLTKFTGSTQNTENLMGGFASASSGIFMIFIGGVLIIIGVAIIYLVNIGKIFSYVAKETSPGTEKITHAVGKGLASGIKEGIKNKK